MTAFVKKTNHRMLLGIAGCVLVLAIFSICGEINRTACASLGRTVTHFQGYSGTCQHGVEHFQFSFGRNGDRT